MDLQYPERKMSKSLSSPLGTVLLFDEPDEIVRKVRKAVTDTEPTVDYDPEHRPGVANLLELLASATGQKPQDLAGSYDGYGQLKADVADALVELLRPIREKRVSLAADPGAVGDLMAVGAAKAEAVAGVTYRRAAEAIGLLPPG